MKISIFKLFAVMNFITIVFCFAVSGASAADVFSGNWKVNLAKSKYDPGPPPKGPNTSKIDATKESMRKASPRTTNGAGSLTERTIRSKALRPGIQPR